MVVTLGSRTGSVPGGSEIEYHRMLFTRRFL